MTYDLAIIGGGPAGVAAGVYAARKRLKTVFITKDFQGQSAVSENIFNWIGTQSISGTKLADDLKAHLYSYKGEGFDIQDDEWVKKVTRVGHHYTITTDRGSYDAKTVLVTAGSSRRKLDVPGAKKFDNKGLTYCASCDGPLFSGMDVAVVGGGNAAFETAAQLLAYCKSVTIIHRGPEFKADEITVEKVTKNEKVRVIKNAEVLEIKGEAFVTGIVVRQKDTDQTSEVPVQGVFVEIGSIPNTDFIAGVVEHDEYGRIKVNPKTQRASRIGVWAAGDCTDGLFHQNNIAAGDAIKAVEDIYLHVHNRQK